MPLKPLPNFSTSSSPAAQPPSMAAGLSVTSTSTAPVRYGHNPIVCYKPTSVLSPTLLIYPSVSKFCGFISKKPHRTVRFVLKKNDDEISGVTPLENEIGGMSESAAARVAEKMARKRSERFTYLVAAVMSSLGITSMAILAVYYRFSWQMQGDGEIPCAEMFGTFALSFGAAVGMEFWARWAHKALWHASLWNMHESHHRPREGPFELNDVFAITNAVPAIALLYYGFLNKGLVPGLCFGAGLGITVFGMAYMFVHDGLVHRRFPVGPIANVPYFRRVAAARQLHHSDKFDGVPYGLFLGPKELEEVGGIQELDKEVNRRINLYKNLDTS